MMRKRMTLLYIAAAVAPLFAQDGTEVVTNRTPASAQRFLKGSPAMYFGIEPKGQMYILDTGESSDACTTVFAGPHALLDTDRLLMTPEPGATIERSELDWRKVDGITPGQSGFGLWIKIQASRAMTTEVTLYYRTEQARDRSLAAA